MTRIHVDTDALCGAAAQTQLAVRACKERVEAVGVVLREMDLEIRARGHFDRRLAGLKAEAGSQAEQLARHSEFLRIAAERYERAEDAAVAGAVDGAQVDSEAPASDTTRKIPEQPPAVSREDFAKALLNIPDGESVDWEQIANVLLDFTPPGNPVAVNWTAYNVASAESGAEAYSEFVLGITPFGGTLQTLAEKLADANPLPQTQVNAERSRLLRLQLAWRTEEYRKIIQQYGISAEKLDEGLRQLDTIEQMYRDMGVW